MSDSPKEARGEEGCASSLGDVDADQLRSTSVADRVDVFAALGNETRYTILLVLVEADEPVCGCELQPCVDVGQSTVSQALNRLHRAGLVTRTKDGRWRYYEPTQLAERLLAVVEPPATGEPALAE